MDGTLIDSEKLWDRALAELSSSLGRELDSETRSRTLGCDMRGLIGVLGEHTGHCIDEAKFQRLHRTLTDRVAELFAVGLEWMPGARELLDAAAELDIPVALVTNTEAELANPAIDFLGRNRFSVIVTGDAVERTKPAPDPYLLAASLLGTDPAECVVVEDSIAGTTSAVNAGCRVLMVPSLPNSGSVEGAASAPSLAGLGPKEIAARTARNNVGQSRP